MLKFWSPNPVGGRLNRRPNCRGRPESASAGTRAMMADPEQSPTEHDRLIRKLESIAELSEASRQALRTLPLTPKLFAADTDMVRQGDRPTQCCLIVEGFGCRYKLLDDGRRQIMSFHTPGDIIDLHGLHIELMDHSIGTLVPTRTALIPHQNLRELSRNFPELASAFWRDTLIDAAIFREWMVGLGRR